MKNKFITYYRVGKKPNKNLILAEQKKMTVQLPGEIIGEFTEIETGKFARRPELVKAIAAAKKSGATLAIAKLDRMERNMAFTTILRDADVEFLCCDNPLVNNQTIHVVAAMAENEQKRISQRVKDALQKTKREKGTLLGSAQPGRWKDKEHLRGWQDAIAESAKIRKQRTKDIYSTLIPTVTEMKAHGKTFAEIADELNKRGLRTQRGTPWSASTLFRVLERVQKPKKKAVLQRVPEDILERMHGKAAQGMKLREIAEWLNEEGIPTPRGGKWDESLVFRKINPRTTKEKVTA